MSKRVDLSSREREVVVRLRAHKPYKQIAHELGVAESTARVLGSRALRKMRTTRTALRLVRTRTRTAESATTSHTA